MERNYPHLPELGSGYGARPGVHEENVIYRAVAGPARAMVGDRKIANFAELGVKRMKDLSHRTFIFIVAKRRAA